MIRTTDFACPNCKKPALNIARVIMKLCAGRYKCTSCAEPLITLSIKNVDLGSYEEVCGAVEGIYRKARVSQTIDNFSAQKSKKDKKFDELLGVDVD